MRVEPANSIRSKGGAAPHLGTTFLTPLEREKAKIEGEKAPASEEKQGWSDGNGEQETRRSGQSRREKCCRNRPLKEEHAGKSEPAKKWGGRTEDLDQGEEVFGADEHAQGTPGRSLYGGRKKRISEHRTDRDRGTPGGEKKMKKGGTDHLKFLID